MSKVLIVDDEPSFLTLLQLELSVAGFETAVAADGRTALRRIESEKPDVVLLDIMMPVLDGWEVLKLLREQNGPQPRVIVVTAKSAEIGLERALELGADGFMSKPFDADKLIATVKDLAKKGLRTR
ncbi:MAG TPA: response regulator [Actinomycetota bacterium]|nr:response regulator [Actinomycetota bacterium]